MSRNLCATHCVHCDHQVTLLEYAHEITEEEAGVYYSEYEGMIVAEAECPICLAHYLAWLDESKRKIHRRHHGGDPLVLEVRDLSYYSTFNDEPGADDFGRYDGPQYDVQKITTWHRVCKIGN